MWTLPWGYREGFAFPIGILCLGFITHFLFGVIPEAAWGYPLNVIGGGAFLLLSLMVGLLAKKYAVARFFSTHYAAVGGMSVWGMLLIIMGLTRQISPEQIAAHGVTGWIHSIGWSHILSTRYFLYLYLYVLWTLGGTTVYWAVKNLKWKKETSCTTQLQEKNEMGSDYATTKALRIARKSSFLLNHAGLYIALWAGLFGAHQIEKLQLQAEKGAEYPEWRAHRQGKTQLMDMDFAIGLSQFTLEEYPPKLMLIDSAGHTLPATRPWHYSVEHVPATTHCGEWTINVEEHLPYSAPVVSKDSLHYVAFGSKGGVQSLRIEARHRSSGKVVKGWVSAGSYIIPHRALELEPNRTIVMPELEPKQYRSEVFLIAKDGTKTSATISVNHPLVFKDWYIYQLDYDHEKGRWSDTSVFELVRDPWLPLVYLGLVMMMLGALALFIIPQRSALPHLQD